MKLCHSQKCISVRPSETAIKIELLKTPKCFNCIAGLVRADSPKAALKEFCNCFNPEVKEGSAKGWGCAEVYDYSDRPC